MRLLRRTRVRLMAVSGLVTLLILVVLEGAVYATVSNRIETAALEQLTTISKTGDIRGGSSDDYTFAPTGPRAGVYPILVDPLGSVIPNLHMGPVPDGLPDKAGLAAVVKLGDSDTRDITLPDGTPCRVMTYFSLGAPADKVQLVQNRTGEVSLLNILGTVLLAGGLLALLAALLGGYLYAGRALVPIRASIDRRQAALQRQREFAANASHELRTPLTVIGASVEDLKRNPRSKVQDVGEALGDIDAEVRHMTALVEDMLLLARTDSGVVQVDRVSLDLSDVAVEAVSVLTTLGQERGVKVMLDPLPAPISGDPLRLRQLVTILTDNAIRHSSSGSTVTVWVRPEPAGALLQVDDQGPGVRPDDLPRLFERFWRADDAPAGGTGLGLAIAKWIVEQHAGTIGVFNRPQGGASFWARLPNVPVPGSAADPGPWTAPMGWGTVGAPDEPPGPEAWGRPQTMATPEPPASEPPTSEPPAG
jgi:signal transduction histidine kinase